ncbi:hypothetical protein XAP6164_2490012 [Xanthomonas phaseoli pv. phaseoli]|nr:hypothetical protein XAP6164_2490012 [Xanthomonas phaseoli pv. phaseoli]
MCLPPHCTPKNEATARQAGIYFIAEADVALLAIQRWN